MLRRMSDDRYQESDREEETPGGKTREDMESVGLKVGYVINRRKWKKKSRKSQIMEKPRKTQKKKVLDSRT